MSLSQINHSTEPYHEAPEPASAKYEEVGMISAKFIPYFLDGSPHTPNQSDAYIHVRVTGQPQPNGSSTVYLPDGTALVVPVRDLLRLVPTG
jgi:hypothetical protein